MTTFTQPEPVKVQQAHLLEEYDDDGSVNSTFQDRPQFEPSGPRRSLSPTGDRMPVSTKPARHM